MNELALMDRCKELALENERLTVERDAAIKDIDTIMHYIDHNMICHICAKFGKCDKSDTCKHEWRGVQL